VIAALVQYQDWTHVLLVFGVFAIGQTLEGYVLVPKLVGDKIGLHPVAVIFAVLAGGELFGFLGVLLALPVASVVMVVLRYLYARYMASALYTTEAEPGVIVVAEKTEKGTEVFSGAVASSGPAESAENTSAPFSDRR
jgi:predicted PurR-regulated permease PerM